MSKTKLDNRIENAMNAFFENKPELNCFELAYAGEQGVKVADKPLFSERAEKWSRILSEVFMFGPGTFALFFYTLTMVFNYPSVAPSPYFYFLAIFLTYAGCGNIKNLKHLAVPASVIAMALATVFSATLLLGRDVASFYFWHSIYLIPVVLITAKLIQGWVADKD